MIDISLNLSHPFDLEFKNFWSKAWSTPIKNKFVELEFYTTQSLLGFNFLWTARRDHAGIDLQMSLLGICAHVSLYDNRHWDHEQCQYHIYDKGNSK